MAKKSAKKKGDPLAILLKLLARADRDTARAVRFLCKAILSPVQEPTFKICKFTYEKKKYSAVMTSDHCRAIQKVVKEQGNVLAEVGSLLSGETVQVVAAIAALMTSLGEETTGTKPTGTKPTSTKPVQLGCCAYQGGQTPNLSQSQCNQFSPSTWDSGDPTCTNMRP